MCKHSLSPEQDIKFTGHVSWVGNTSMEVKMKMFQVCMYPKIPSLFKYNQLVSLEEKLYSWTDMQSTALKQLTVQGELASSCCTKTDTSSVTDTFMTL
jgi:hypothetical protein